MNSLPIEPCAFCEIMNGRLAATIVAANNLVIALVDLRQFHPGHVLIVPRQHIADIRDADDETSAAIMQMVARVSRAVAKTFPNDGLSIWHSVGEGANQEVPHLHFHVHPRLIGDDLLRIYPQSPSTPNRATLERIGEEMLQAMNANPVKPTLPEQH